MVIVNELCRRICCMVLVNEMWCWSVLIQADEHFKRSGVLLQMLQPQNGGPEVLENSRTLCLTAVCVLGHRATFK